MEQIGQLITESDLPVSVKVALIIASAALFVLVVAVIIILGVEYFFTPDYAFIPALLRDPGAALGEVWGHMVWLNVATR